MLNCRGCKVFFLMTKRNDKALEIINVDTKLGRANINALTYANEVTHFFHDGTIWFCFWLSLFHLSRPSRTEAINAVQVLVRTFNSTANAHAIVWKFLPILTRLICRCIICDSCFECNRNFIIRKFDIARIEFTLIFCPDIASVRTSDYPLDATYVCFN